MVFRDRLDTTTYYTFDSFESSNPINILSAEVSMGIGQTGTFRISIEDSSKVIDTKVFGLANKVYLYAGKTQNTYTPLMVGICRSIDIERQDTGLLVYHVNGYGLSIVFNETVINFRRSAFRQELGSSNPSTEDVSHQAYNLVTELVTSENVFPIQGVPSIIARYNLGTNGIDPKVKDFLSSINEQNIEASHAMNIMANATGSLWGVDRFGQVFFKYAQFEYSPIVLKDTVEATDLADRTSYFNKSWKRTMSMKREDGFANILFAKTSSETIENFIEANSAGSTMLLNRAIAQMWVPTASRFTNMGFLLKKIGDPQSTPRNVLEGRIKLDNGGFPTGNTLLSFAIPLEEIKTKATPVMKLDINFSGITVEIGRRYWVILYHRGTSEKSTIEWLHNNDFSKDTDVLNLNSALSDPDGRYGTLDLRWNVSQRGPVYAFATFDSLSHLVYAEEPLSVEKYGRSELFLDVRGLDDNRTIDKYLHTYLELSAKPIIFYTINRVTIPDSLFYPGQLITIVDSLSGMPRSAGITAEIQEVRYEFNAQEDGFGTRFCEIRPLGYYDYLSELEGTCP